MPEQPGPEWDAFLREIAAAHGSCQVPCTARARTEEYARVTLAALFPHFSRVPQGPDFDAVAAIREVDQRLREMLCTLELGSDRERTIRESAMGALPEVRKALIADAEAIHNGDPAAVSVDEVILAYPGFYAIAVFRLAHVLHVMGVPLLPRLLTEFAHRETGIDIHPGAQIGVPFQIDHGTGVVIGETTVIGANVKLFQGVTLGALSVHKSLASTKRHPTIENNVVIYAGATILGGETVIGANSTIGGNAWITESVPPNSVVLSALASEVRTRRVRS